MDGFSSRPVQSSLSQETSCKQMMPPSVNFFQHETPGPGPGSFMESRAPSLQNSPKLSALDLCCNLDALLWLPPQPPLDELLSCWIERRQHWEKCWALDIQNPCVLAFSGHAVNCIQAQAHKKCPKGRGLQSDGSFSAALWSDFKFLAFPACATRTSGFGSCCGLRGPVSFIWSKILGESLYGLNKE